MKRRRVIVILLLAATLAIVGAVVLFHAQEPAYQGKKLTAWIDDYARLTVMGTRSASIAFISNHNQIADAFATMGTNCIPFIFRRLERQDSALQTKYRDWWPKSPKALLKVLPQPAPFLEAESADFLLDFSGEVPFKVLFSEMKSRGSTAREVAVNRISHFRLSPSQMDQVFPVMIARLSDPNSMTRLYAAGFLGEQGPKASKALPALIQALRLSDAGPRPRQKPAARASVATVLGKIGPPAASAIPTLKSLLSDPDSNLRSETAIAIWRIDADAETTVHILINELPGSSSALKSRMINALAEMGPRAKDAVTALEIERLGATPILLDQIYSALLKIDPKAAAKFGDQ